MTDANGYYDFPEEIEIESILIENGYIDDLFHLKDLQQRKLFLHDGIDLSSVEYIVKNILQYNKEDKGIDADKRTPILLYVTSYGGQVDAGFELIDVIMSSKTPVYTINLGFQYSMGFLIGLAGHKRFATPNAKFLIHDGTSVLYGSGAKVQDEMEFNKRVEQRIKDYIISRSAITSKEYNGKLRVEWYMFANEAKEKGITDCIIGVDCDIDEVV